MWETWVWSLGWEDPLEKGKGAYSSILAENSMDCIVPGVSKSWTWLNDFHTLTMNLNLTNSDKTISSHKLHIRHNSFLSITYIYYDIKMGYLVCIHQRDIYIFSCLFIHIGPGLYNESSTFLEMWNIRISMLFKAIPQHLYILTWRRQWHPTPVLLPGKSHGRRSLVGCSPWGR